MRSVWAGGGTSAAGTWFSGASGLLGFSRGSGFSKFSDRDFRVVSPHLCCNVDDLCGPGVSLPFPLGPPSPQPRVRWRGGGVVCAQAGSTPHRFDSRSNSAMACWCNFSNWGSAFLRPGPLERKGHSSFGTKFQFSFSFVSGQVKPPNTCTRTRKGYCLVFCCGLGRGAWPLGHWGSLGSCCWFRYAGRIFPGMQLGSHIPVSNQPPKIRRWTYLYIRCMVRASNSFTVRVYLST